MKKRIVAVALASVLALSTLLTGCGQPAASEVVASFGDTQITYGVASFYARYQEVMYDANYLGYFGEDMWSTSYGEDVTMYDSMKSDVMTSLEQIYRLVGHAEEYGIALSDEDQAAIDAAVEGFTAKNSAASLEAMNATDAASIAEFLRAFTIATRVQTAIREETEITVTADDAASKTIRYVRVGNTTYTDAEGNSATYTEEEVADLKANVQKMADEMKTAMASADAEGEDLAVVEAESSGDATASTEDAFDTIASAYGYTSSKYSYAADEDYLDAAIIEAVNGMQEGAISDVIEGESAFYVVIYDSAYDAEATASYLEELIYNQKADHFTEVYETMQAESEFVINEKVWSKLKLDKLFSVQYDAVETTETGDAE